MTKIESSHFRIITYNIHKGIGGVDRRYNLQRIVDVIQHYQPDLALLQEVDSGVPRSGQDEQTALLADALGYPYSACQQNVHLKSGCYGNAILSRFPLDGSSDLDLTIPLKKRRQALTVRANIPIGRHTRSLLLCNTHLGLAGFERTIQIKRILSSAELNHLHTSTPAIVGGDFNDVWSSHGRKLMLPVGFQCAVRKTRTFPAAMAIRSLDAIYYRGDLRLLESFAGHIKLARQASDHLPVIADFEISAKS